MDVRKISQLSDLNLALNFEDLSGKIVSIDGANVSIKLYTSKASTILIIEHC